MFPVVNAPVDSRQDQAGCVYRMWQRSCADVWSPVGPLSSCHRLITCPNPFVLGSEPSQHSHPRECRWTARSASVHSRPAPTRLTIGPEPSSWVGYWVLRILDSQICHCVCIFILTVISRMCQLNMFYVHHHKYVFDIKFTNQTINKSTHKPRCRSQLHAFSTNGHQKIFKKVADLLFLTQLVFVTQGKCKELIDRV